MNDNRTGGQLLVAGCVAGLITMAFHPVGAHGDHLPPAHVLQMLAMHDRVVHGLALIGVAMTFLGALALSRRLAAANRVALAALVFYGFAAVAIMVAACLSGFVGADILSRMVEGDPKLESRRMLLDYTFRLNQAFASVYTAGSCAAIFLWSLALIRARPTHPVLGWYGLVLAPVVVLALFSGHLSLDVHGFGLVVLAQSIWFLGAGTLLIRTDAGAGEPAAADLAG